MDEMAVDNRFVRTANPALQLLVKEPKQVF